MIAFVLQQQSWIVTLQQRLYDLPTLQYVVSSPLQKCSTNPDLAERLQVGAPMSKAPLTFCVTIWSQANDFLSGSLTLIFLKTGEYKSNLFFPPRNAVKIDKKTKPSLFSKSKIIQSIIHKVDDSEMMTNVLLFFDMRSLVYLSGGLFRSVRAYRPLHHGTTSN